jgi:cytochrome c-type biogenesis protein CcmH/NrfF
MRSLALPIAAAALLALVAVAALQLVVPREPPTAAERAHTIAAELRCPDCQALSVAESRTASALAIRAEIDELLAAGRSADEIRQHFVARYGEWILLSPSGALPWVLPLAALAVGLALLAWWLGAGRRRVGPGRAGAAPPVSDAQRRQVSEELERLDG